MAPVRGQRLVDRAAGLRRVKLDDRGASDLELIRNGAYSPLKGFMTPRDYLRVVRERWPEAPHIVMVGDAWVDGVAAQAGGIPFIGAENFA